MFLLEFGFAPSGMVATLRQLHILHAKLTPSSDYAAIIVPHTRGFVEWKKRNNPPRQPSESSGRSPVALGGCGMAAKPERAFALFRFCSCSLSLTAHLRLVLSGCAIYSYDAAASRWRSRAVVMAAGKASGRSRTVQSKCGRISTQRMLPFGRRSKVVECVASCMYR